MRLFCQLCLSGLLIVASGNMAQSAEIKKSAEKIFAHERGIELKIVAFEQNIPLHYAGPTYRVLCRSEKTAHLTETNYNEAGWTPYVAISTSLAPHLINTNSEQAIDIENKAAIASPSYQIMDDKTMMFVAGGNILNVTWDGCASFAAWNPVTIKDDDLIKTSPAFEKCLADLETNKMWPHTQKAIADAGSPAAACKYAKFEEARFIVTNMKASASGTASADISTPALAQIPGLKVSTTDFGETWTVAPLVLGAPL